MEENLGSISFPRPLGRHDISFLVLFLYLFLKGFLLELAHVIVEEVDPPVPRFQHLISYDLFIGEPWIYQTITSCYPRVYYAGVSKLA